MYPDPFLLKPLTALLDKTSYNSHFIGKLSETAQVSLITIYMLMTPECTTLAQTALKFSRSTRSLNPGQLHFDMSKTNLLSPHL